MNTNPMLSPLDIRMLLGAIGPDGARHDMTWPEPSIVDEDGFYRYNGIMKCRECPMCLHTSGGVCALTCSITSRGVLFGQSCSLGITSDGKGLVHNDFAHREKMIDTANDRQKTCCASKRHVTFTINDTAFEHLRETAPDLNFYRIHDIDALSDATGINRDILLVTYNRIHGINA